LGIFAGFIYVVIAEVGSLRVAAALICSSLVAPIEEVSARVSRAVALVLGEGE
jgi:hypothetical protein